jgi:hypothetical protein
MQISAAHTQIGRTRGFPASEFASDFAAIPDAIEM